MKIRKSGDAGVFYVESSSKTETEEHTVDLFELVCTCTDYTARCSPRRRINRIFVPHPSPERTACKHLTQVLLQLGLHTAERWKKEHNKQT
jgi:hypothetical protein